MKDFWLWIKSDPAMAGICGIVDGCSAAMVASVIYAFCTTSLWSWILKNPLEAILYGILIGECVFGSVYITYASYDMSKY